MLIWPPSVFRVNLKHGHCKPLTTFIVIFICKRRKKICTFCSHPTLQYSIYSFIVVIELYFRYILPQWHWFLSARDNQTEQAAAHIREWRYHLLNEVGYALYHSLRCHKNFTIIFSLRLTVKAKCPMMLNNFPMDQQACPLIFGSCKLWKLRHTAFK